MSNRGLVQYAWDAFKEKDYPRAEQAFAGLLDLSPDSAEIVWGYTISRVVQLDDSVESANAIDSLCTLCQQALELHEKRQELTDHMVEAAYFQIGSYRKLQGRIEEARTAFQSLIAQQAGSGFALEAFNELAGLECSAQNWIEAERLLKEGLESHPDHPKLLRNLKWVQKNKNQIEIHIQVIALGTGPRCENVVRQVNPEDTLEAAVQPVLAEMSLSCQLGMMVRGGDNTLPGHWGMDDMDPRKTLQELGVKHRDTIMFVEISNRTTSLNEPSPPTLPESLSFVSAWERTVEAGGEPSCVAILGGDRLLVSNGNRVCCLSSRTGEDFWQINSPHHQTPVISGQTILLADRQSVRGLDLVTGRTRWQWEAALPSQPVADEEQFWVLTQAGELIEAERETGNILTRKSLGGSMPAGECFRLAVSEDSLVALARDHVMRIDRTAGTIQWTVLGRFDETSPVIAEGRLYLGTFEDGVWCLNLESGRRDCIFCSQSWVRITPTVTRGRVFLGNLGSQAGCLDALTGELIWTQQNRSLSTRTLVASPLVVENLVYFLYSDGALFALDFETGTEIWSAYVWETWETGFGSLSQFDSLGNRLFYTSPKGRVGSLVKRDDTRQTRQSQPLTDVSQSNSPPLPPTQPGMALASVPDWVLMPHSLPKKAKHLVDRAVCLLFAGHPDEASAIFRGLRFSHPQEPIVLIGLAEAYRAAGLIGDSLAVWNQLLAAKPNNQHAVEGIQTLLRQHPCLVERLFGSWQAIPSPPEIPRDQPLPPEDLSRDLIQDKPILICRPKDLVVECLRHGLAWFLWRQPEPGKLMLCLEWDYQRYQHFRLQTVFDLDSPSDQTWLDRLEQTDQLPVYFWSKTFQFAREFEIRPEQQQRLRELRTLGQSHGKSLFQSVRGWREDPSRVEARQFSNRGVELLAQSNLWESIEQFREALERDPTSSDALYGLGRSLHHLARDENAQVGGLIYFRAGLHWLDEAIACFERLTKLDATAGDAWFNLGLAYDNRGQLELAEQAYRQVISLLPGTLDAVDALGNLTLLFTNQALGIAGLTTPRSMIAASITQADIDRIFQTGDNWLRKLEWVSQRDEMLRPELEQAYRTMARRAEQFLQGQRAANYSQRMRDLDSPNSALMETVELSAEETQAHPKQTFDPNPTSVNREETTNRNLARILPSRERDAPGTFRFGCLCGFQFLGVPSACGQEVTCPKCNAQQLVPPFI